MQTLTTSVLQNVSSAAAAAAAMSCVWTVAACMHAVCTRQYGVTSAEAQKQLARVPVFFIKDPSGMYCMSSLRPYTSVDESLDECGYVQDPLTARAVHIISSSCVVQAALTVC
eukprot:2596-Heterococcus_DN1.PRE.1